MIRLSRCAVPDCVWLDADKCSGMLSIDELRQLIQTSTIRDIEELIESLNWTEDNTPAERPRDTERCVPEGKA